MKSAFSRGNGLKHDIGNECGKPYSAIMRKY